MKLDHSVRVHRLVIALGLLGAAVAYGATVPAADAVPAVGVVTVPFTTAGTYAFVVPAGVSSLTVTAVGGAGGSCEGTGGGSGESVTATIPATPGETLFVGVGGSGGNCGLAAIGGPGGAGAGGIGGGAAGGYADEFPGNGGAGGGGASVVGIGPASPGFGALVVAGGGGGAAEQARGGSAGLAGASGSGGGGGGGAGSTTSGGAGGAAGSGGHGGGAGAAGVGGAGGVNGGSGVLDFGGGGGGGGYYGGGGGGAGGQPTPASGGGGGGGSSFTASVDTDVTTTTGTTPEVTIQYAAAGASESVSSLTFQSVEQSAVSPAQSVTLTSNGSAPLVVSGYTLTGADPDDYIVEDGCTQPVATGSTCHVDVRFAPQASGPSTATLTLLSNSQTAIVPVTLSGTGGSPLVGAQGETGPAGAPGATGPAGPAGQLELVTCRTVVKTSRVHGHTHRTTSQRCTGKLISGTVKFTAAPVVHAALARGATTYATGEEATASGRTRLVLTTARALRRGRYTLILRAHTGRGVVVRRTAITLT